MNLSKSLIFNDYYDYDIMCKITTNIITEIRGIMWQKGVVWTRFTLLLGILEVNIKLIKDYIKVDCSGFDELTAVLYPNCGVTAV